VKAAGFRRQDFRVFVPDGFRELIALRKRQDGHARGDHGRWNLRASLPNLHTVLSLAAPGGTTNIEIGSSFFHREDGGTDAVLSRSPSTNQYHEH